LVNLEKEQIMSEKKEKLSEIVAEPLQIMISGKPYKLSPITIKTWAAIEQFIRQQNLIDLEIIGNSEERKALRLEVLKSDIDVNSALSRMDVSIHLVYLALKDNEGITKDKVIELLSGTSLADITEQILTLSLPDAHPPTAAAE